MRAKIDPFGMGRGRYVRKGHILLRVADVMGLIMGEDHIFRADVGAARLAQKPCRHGSQPGDKGLCRVLGG